MFTGIVEEKGQLLKVLRSPLGYQLTIKAQKVLKETKIGDSIAVNGICLTVTDLKPGMFLADVMKETLRKTNLEGLPIKSDVNLERALSLKDRLGGHIVSGHIDGTGKVAGLSREGNAVWLEIKSSRDLLKYMIQKGSIAIDGVSLTIAKIGSQSFSVSLIPHTGEETTLLSKKAGDVVNLECDIWGKYLERLLTLQDHDEASSGRANDSTISKELLGQYGYL